MNKYSSHGCQGSANQTVPIIDLTKWHQIGNAKNHGIGDQWFFVKVASKEECDRAKETCWSTKKECDKAKVKRKEKYHSGEEKCVLLDKSSTSTRRHHGYLTEDFGWPQRIGAPGKGRCVSKCYSFVEALASDLCRKLESSCSWDPKCGRCNDKTVKDRYRCWYAKDLGCKNGNNVAYMKDRTGKNWENCDKSSLSSSIHGDLNRHLKKKLAHTRLKNTRI